MVATADELHRRGAGADRHAEPIERSGRATSSCARRLSRSVGGDIAAIFAEAVRERANPRINQANCDSIVQP